MANDLIYSAAYSTSLSAMQYMRLH